MIAEVTISGPQASSSLLHQGAECGRYHSQFGPGPRSPIYWLLQLISWTAQQPHSSSLACWLSEQTSTEDSWKSMVLRRNCQTAVARIRVELSAHAPAKALWPSQPPQLAPRHLFLGPPLGLQLSTPLSQKTSRRCQPLARILSPFLEPLRLLHGNLTPLETLRAEIWRPRCLR